MVPGRPPKRTVVVGNVQHIVRTRGYPPGGSSTSGMMKLADASKMCRDLYTWTLLVKKFLLDRKVAYEFSEGSNNSLTTESFMKSKGVRENFDPCLSWFSIQRPSYANCVFFVEFLILVVAARRIFGNPYMDNKPVHSVLTVSKKMSAMKGFPLTGLPFGMTGFSESCAEATKQNQTKAAAVIHPRGFHVWLKSNIASTTHNQNSAFVRVKPPIFYSDHLSKKKTLCLSL